MEDSPILIYDGTCSFCSASVDFILRHEKSDTMKFLWLQNALTKDYMVRYDIPENTDSIVLIENDKAFIKSEAALRIATYLRRPFNWMKVFRIVPLSLRDLVYDLIAKNRKKIMGSTSCALPIGKEDRFVSAD